MHEVWLDSLIPWKRAGMGRGRFYDGQVTEKIETAAEMQRQTDINEPLDGDICVFTVFWKRKPKAMTRKKLEASPFCSVKPDIDNLNKYLFDVMQHQAGLITDDARICSCISFKLWGYDDRTLLVFGRSGVGRDVSFSWPYMDIGLNRYSLIGGGNKV
jgi:Holliday junction resolvase RusA-like endonuclease